MAILAILPQALECIAAGRALDLAELPAALKKGSNARVANKQKHREVLMQSQQETEYLWKRVWEQRAAIRMLTPCQPEALQAGRLSTE